MEWDMKVWDQFLILLEGKLKNIPSWELSKDFKYYDESRIILNPKNSIGFNGKIYLLTDGVVFSSKLRQDFQYLLKVRDLLLSRGDNRWR